MIRFVLLALCSTVAGLATAAAAEDASWKEYVYPNDDFAISAPAEPTMEKKSMHVSGGNAEAHVYSMPTGGNGVFMVVVNLRHSADRRSDQQVLDEALIGAKRTFHATTTAQSDVKLGNYAGSQLELNSAAPGGKNKHVRDRFFVVGRRLYQLIAIAAAGEQLPADAERWFESFRLVQDKGQ